MRRVGLLTIGALLSACTSARNHQVSTGTADATAVSVDVAVGVAANATVVHIDDGDTIDVEIAGHRTRVRLIGIDTPETKKPNTPVQCYGHEATAETTALLPLGTAVRLERDVEARDPYDRLLAYVYRADDGLFVNLELARLGFARQLSIAPNDTHATEFAGAVATAVAGRIGLWAACPSFGSPAAG